MTRTISQAGETRSARIESLRALAALGVLESHTWGYAQHWSLQATYGALAHRVLVGLGSGVLVFFALSGYLLFWPFAKRWFGEGQHIDLRRYALNRVLRILPLYYVAVAVFLLLGQSGGTPSQWWHFGLLAENFSTSTLGKVDGPLWSVVVEVHFYALLPLFAWGLAWVARRRWGLAVAALLAVGVTGALFRAWALRQGWHTSQLVRYSLPGTFYFFIPGMLLAMLRLRWNERGALARPWLWLLVALPFWVWHWDRFSDAPAAVGSFLLVGACVLPTARRSRVVSALEWRPLAALGVASYSIYIWHMPIVHSLQRHTNLAYVPLLLLSLVVCCAIALASYRLIEAPALALRKRWSSAGELAPEPVVEQRPIPAAARAHAIS